MPGQSKSLDGTDAPAVATVAVEDLPTRVGGPCCRVIGNGTMERWNDGTMDRSNDNAIIGGASTKRRGRERSRMKDN